MTHRSTPSDHPGDTLRPLERRVARMIEQGVNDVEIAWRFRKSPRFVRQVRGLAGRPTRPARGPSAPSPDGLRPLERRLLRWREQGFSHEELAPRFRRTPDFLVRVEALAHYKLDRR